MNTRHVVATSHAPQAIGPYSQAIATDALVFVSGQIALDPTSGEALTSEPIETQTHRVLHNLQAVLEEAGTSLAKVVKTTVFLTDMNEFAAMNGVYAAFFPDAPPARSTIQVAGLPRGARVEVEAIALR